MEPLTVQYATDNNFTPIDCVKYFKPEWDDQQCDYYIWECTCFPFSTEEMIEQLNKEFLRHEQK